jgi:arginyl-tRNA synthetase
MATVPYDFQSHFEEVIGAVARSRCGFGEEFRAQVQPADARFGDFQANGAFAYGKAVGANPRQLGQRLVEALREGGEFSGELATVELAGAGFLNVTLTPAALARWLEAYGSAEALGSASRHWEGRTVLIDYSCPNSAKQMHVGHLRSLVIGDALHRILKFCGAKVLRDNHIGDWGTQFGILLRQIRTEAVDLDALPAEDAIEALEGLYRRGHAATQESAAALEEARAELVALQNGDEGRLKLWEKINALSYATFQEIYDLAGVQFDYVLGESFYRNSVGRVYEELEECALAAEDNGALVVFHREHGRFREQPFLVRKSDGASNYASTDLATALYRTETLAADEIIYVTDARQRDHFEQLFLTVEKWFRAKGYRLPRLTHVWFGTVCGEDGRAIKTRSGQPIRLKSLFADAIRRAREIVGEKNPGLDGETRERIARAVGVGAIKYGDLCQNRSGDYVFSLEKMLAFDGDTAPYLQYAAARIHAIFRKIPDNLPPFEKFPMEGPATAEERALARRLVLFPVALRQTLDDFRPHLLCGYLYGLAGDFSTFYNGNRVFGVDVPTTLRRLKLCANSLAVLELGLHLLGIETLEHM